MKTILDLLRQRPALISALIFLLMIVPSLYLFMAAEQESQAGMLILLGGVSLANLLAVFPPQSG